MRAFAIAAVLVLPMLAGASVDPLERAKATVRLQLKDPDSATFRNLKSYTGAQDPIVCGEVNAKNAFGGYVGYMRFTSADDTVLMEQPDSDVSFDGWWNAVCRNR